MPGCLDGDSNTAETDFCIVPSTPAPTATPTPAVPTAMPSLLVQVNTKETVNGLALPNATFIGSDVNGTLQLCEADCDSDADCAAGLVCYEREKGDDIPGCAGVDPSRNDYCIIEPVGATTSTGAPTPDAPKIEMIETSSPSSATTLDSSSISTMDTISSINGERALTFVPTENPTKTPTQTLESTIIPSNTSSLAPTVGLSVAAADGLTIAPSDAPSLASKEKRTVAPLDASSLTATEKLTSMLLDAPSLAVAQTLTTAPSDASSLAATEEVATGVLGASTIASTTGLTSLLSNIPISVPTTAPTPGPTTKDDYLLVAEYAGNNGFSDAFPLQRCQCKLAYFGCEGMMLSNVVS